MAFSKITGKSIDVSTESIAEFNSTGIDDNATSTAITIAANNSVSIPNLHGNTTTIGNLTVGGDFIVQGNNFTIDSTSLKVEDSLIHLAGNNVSNDIIDIGFIGHYSNDSGNTELFTGFYRDATDEQYYLFNGLSDDINTATTIDKTGTGYTYADLNVGDLYIQDGGELRVVRSGQSNYSAIYTDTGDKTIINNSWANKKLVLDRDGNVGIGITSPATNLHILDSNPVVRLQSSGAGTDNTLSFLSRNISDVAAYADIIAEGAGHNSTNAPIVFTQGSGQTERMRIDSSGALGLGTTPPTTNIHPQMFIGSESVILGSASGALDIGNNLYYNSGWKYRTTGAASLQDFDASGNIVFYRAASGSADGAVTLNESMRIDSSGNVGIGTSSSDAKLNIVSDVTPANIDAFGSLIISSTVGQYGPRVNIASSSTTGNGYIWALNRGISETNLILQQYGGYVGIGVTSPSASLDISTGGTTRVKTSDGTRELYSGVWSNQPRIESTNGTLAIAAVGGYDINFGTNGLERMRIDASGKVGIGTDSPTTLIEVEQNSTSGTTGSFPEITATNTNAAGVAGFRANGANGAVAFQLIALTDRARISTLTNQPMTFLTNSAERMRISSGGNVAIGDDDAQYKLDVSTSNLNSPIFRIGYNQRTWAGGELRMGQLNAADAYSSYLQGYEPVGNSPVRAIALNPYGGNVGVGTTTPTNKLDVRGTVASEAQSTTHIAAYNIAAGTYTVGNWYTFTNRSTIANYGYGNGFYIFRIYEDTYGAGGGNYFINYNTEPFYFHNTATNASRAMEFTISNIAMGHAANQFPTRSVGVRVVEQPGTSGANHQFQWTPKGANLTIDQNAGKMIILYLHRFG